MEDCNCIGRIGSEVPKKRMQTVRVDVNILKEDLLLMRIFRDITTKQHDYPREYK